MKLPKSAADDIAEEKNDPGYGMKGEFILNPYHNKELLSPLDAIDCINHLSASLMAHEFIRSQEKY